eukprot:2124574-Amphidinium_carterae.1
MTSCSCSCSLCPKASLRSLMVEKCVAHVLLLLQWHALRAIVHIGSAESAFGTCSSKARALEK